MSAVDLDEWITSEEAAAYTKLSERTLQRACRSGELRCGGSAGRRRYKRRWLDEWLERERNGDGDR